MENDLLIKIINCLDDEINRANKKYLTAVEAAKKLEKKGLLKDSDLRPGLPLRRLLRAGKIPHAFQLGGPYSRWFIPHSPKK